MRYIIYGAGGVGGVVGARLFQAGYEVGLVCRGAHLEAVRRNGLRLIAPDDDLRLPVPAVGHPSELAFGPDDAVILTMKTQDTEAALRDLEAAGGLDLPLVCCQNGVENERRAARRFPRVYAMISFTYTTFLEPGTVLCNAAPVAGVFDVGCYPHGVDAVATRIAADWSRAKMVSVARPDMMRYKYAKLLGNLGNAVQAMISEPLSSDNHRRLADRLSDEGLAVYRAAGIDFASDEEIYEEARRHFHIAAAGGQAYPGGSTWQSLVRDRAGVETDFLNGEVVLLAHQAGVRAPFNTLARRLVAQMAAKGEKPGRYTAAELEAMAEAEQVQAGG
jgi:2-dehydropantoate 2-reductase